MKEYSIFILRKMVDLFGKDKGNISLSTQLQSYEDEDQKRLPTIINLQKTFYSIKIADIENRINRLKTNLNFINTSPNFVMLSYILILCSIIKDKN